MEKSIDVGQKIFGGDWTFIKLEVLKKYLNAFNKALSRQPFSRVYIDAFAGSGQCDIQTENGTNSIKGSATIALEAELSFNYFYFIEKNQKKINALEQLKQQYPTKSKSIRIIFGDANEELKTLCSSFSERKYRSVLFLDPFGMDVAWKTLEMIAKTRTMDVWYLFPYAALFRQTPHDVYKMTDSGKKCVEHILGIDAKELVDKFYKPGPQRDFFKGTPDEERLEHEELLEFVSEQLKTIFPTVLKPRILRNKNKAPLFALYFCISNPDERAKKLATRIARYILDAE